jgi:ubiquinone/menaquinone biosynthesis C-methylase UbiE
LGCGDNADLACYRSEARQVWGADFQPHPHLVAPEWFRPLGPDGTIPFADESFDVVGSRWVLEHVCQPAAFLPEVKRVLVPGGAFVALTVNAVHYASLLARLTHLVPHALTQRLVRRLYGRPCHDTFPTCYRLNTRAEVRRQARRAGLELVAVDRIADQGYFSFSSVLWRGAVVLDYLLERAGTDLGRLYMVVVLRKPAPQAFSAPRPLARQAVRAA